MTSSAVTTETVPESKAGTQEETNEYKEYYLQTDAIKERFIKLLSTKSSFTLKKAQITEYTIKSVCGETQKIKVSCFTEMSNKIINGVPCWYCRSVIPGSLSFIGDVWQESVHRLKWDSQLSFHKKNDLTLTLKTIHTKTHPIAGGLISPREFVHIVRAFVPVNDSNDSIMRVSLSIVDNKVFPQKKGFVRGSNSMYGMVIKKIHDLSQYNLPEIVLKSLPNVMNKNTNQNINGSEKEHVLEWVSVEMIFEVDLCGWIPKKVVENALAGGMISNMAALTQYSFDLHDIQCTSVIK